MEEIKAILDKYDIAGFVVLHTPPFSEHYLKINPSYSCARFEELADGTAIRFKAKLQEDFQGDKVACHKKVTDTINMFDHLSMRTGETAMALIDMQRLIDTKVERYDTDPGESSSHTTQNN